MNTYNQVTPTGLGGKRGKTNVGGSQQQSQEPQEQQVFPASLTAWVQTCYADALQRSFSPEQMAQLQHELQVLIEKANNTGKLWSNDWSGQSIPILNRGSILDLKCNQATSQSKQASAQRSVKNKRATVASKEDEMTSNDRKRLRAQRFERELNHNETLDFQNINREEYKFDKNKPIIGTCTDLEKSYLRLTSAPDPSKVRPYGILVKALNRLMHKYKSGVKYTYLCDQLKALRQDLTVQLIEDDFTVKVYETHGRIAIENSDLGEFNQCQSVLKKLYEQPHIKQSKNGSTNKLEFLSYALIYYLFTNNYDSITEVKLKLQPNDRGNDFIKPALEIIKAKLSKNYHMLFSLYSKTKGTTKLLIECFINNERVKALSVICTAYKQINLEFLLNEFHFQGESDCMDFITDKQLDKFIELKGESIILKAADARSTVLNSLQKVKKVDIKGQV